jgi:hypothetical protein
VPTVDSEELGLIRSQIEDWVKKNVAFPDLKMHGKCHKVVLRHLTVDRKVQGDVKAFPVRLEEGSEDELLPLLLGISEAAQRDADSLNQGLQRYALYAHYSQDAHYTPRKVFTVSPAAEEEVERGVDPTEPPTEKGLVSQTMRHLEAVMRTATLSTSTMMQAQLGEIRRLTELNERFMTQQVDFMVLLQDTLDGSHRRRLDERSEEANLAMKESAMSKLEALVPVIINRLAGKPVLPEEDKSFMMMSALLENLTDEQQAALMTTLSDDQRLVLAEVLAAYEQKKSRWLQGQKQQVLASSPTTPTAPALPAVPLPTTMTLKERISSLPEESPDPHVRRLEADAQAFTDRMRQLTRTKEKNGG